MIAYEPRWGKGRRQAFPIPPETLAAIQADSDKTDAKFAKELGYTRLSIRQIRLRARRRDG